jgi:riboflavin kinase / FMN adenylyltransferase
MTTLPMDLRGMVANDDQGGWTVGLPAANLNGQALLACGVYASQTLGTGGEKVWPSVTSYGMRPTFDGTDQRIETHNIYFQGVIKKARAFNACA